MTPEQLHTVHAQVQAEAKADRIMLYSAADLKWAHFKSAAE